LDDLAHNASEPNVFYESWLLLPALKAFGARSSFTFVLIFASDIGKQPVLCGFLPLEIVSRYRGLPLRTARLWSYLHFSWCAPLLKKGFEVQCLETFCRWASSRESGCRLIEFASFPGEGPLSRALIEALSLLRLPHYIVDVRTRALLQNIGNAEACLRNSIPGRKLKEFGRLGRRLAENGNLIYEELESQDDLPEWIDGFLQLELSGWKGRAGTALASSTEQRTFFRSAVEAAFARNQLMMLRLRLDDRAIAYKVNFLSEPGAFAFKIAYDEDYGSFSPGVLLEIENIRRFQSTSSLAWMDSCADANHFMANHLWSDRRVVQTTLVAARGRFAGFVTATLPLARWTLRNCKEALHSVTQEQSQ
jgi:CelD/BcsL family acetyltransferase involved in cellulose biosynthesis